MPRFWKIVNSVQFSWVPFTSLGSLVLNPKPPVPSQLQASVLGGVLLPIDLKHTRSPHPSISGGVSGR
jgi:hypothetical protein